MKRSITVILSTMISLAAAATFASPGFTCGGNIIMPGDSQAHVEKYCGKPSDVDGWTWTYERGPNQFVVTIHFEADGTVDRITKE